MVRVQLLLREGVGDITPVGGDRRPQGPDPRRIALAWAFVDAPRGLFVGERAHDLSFGAGPVLRLARRPSRISDEWDDVSVPPDADVTAAIVEMRVEADALRGMTTFGRLFLRGTGFPVGDGREGFVAAGLVANPGDLPEATLMSFEGEGAMGLVGCRPVPEAVVPGMAATFPFRQPIWGLDDGPRAFVSTMHPDVIAVCARHAVLENEPVRTAREEAEFARLCATPEVRSVRNVGTHDRDYQAWREHVREGGRWRELSPNFDEYPTRAESDAREVAMAEAMSEWMAGCDGPRLF